MDKAKLKKILIKAKSLQGKEVGLAKEFVELEDKIESSKNEIIRGMPDLPRDNVTESSVIFDLPEFPERIEIANFPNTQRVEVLNFPKQAEQKAPIVNIEAPKVNIEAPIVNIDTETLEKELKTSNETLKEISEKLNKEEVEEETETIDKVTLVDEEGKPMKFPSSGGASSPSKYIRDKSGEFINPATEEKQDTQISQTNNLPNTFNDESLWLLRRMVKLMESGGVVDMTGRQRLVVEGTVYNLPSSYYAAANQFNIPSNVTSAPMLNASVTYVQPVQTGPYDPRWKAIEDSRVAYNQGIRSHLSFS